MYKQVSGDFSDVVQERKVVLSVCCDGVLTFSCPSLSFIVRCEAVDLNVAVHVDAVGVDRLPFAVVVAIRAEAHTCTSAHFSK